MINSAVQAQKRLNDLTDQLIERQVSEAMAVVKVIEPRPYSGIPHSPMQVVCD